MAAASDRTWDLPKQPWVLQMMWSKLLFAHWPVEPSVLASLLPDGLQLDIRDGQAWVGVVPFLMSNVRPRCCPSIPILSSFLELNVRTYVTLDGKPGVWFFSLDAASWFAVRAARATYHLPYMDAKMSLSKEDASAIRYRSERTQCGEPPASFDASYQCVGKPFHARPGTLEFWLTARYCLYSIDRHGRVCRGEIDHASWTLSSASWRMRQNTMGNPWQFDLTGQPHLLVAQPVKVCAWMPVRCG
ncbi:hypothetical protein Q31a_40630 [Aureliella helgolandensis]|uniref:DUF2071 domain-containing protein n=2 Tax=Aureliella helgolandensis TaxID=2527968 RepID=A0A518GAV1_9BACT|nr:hypothetical protein Q31a_40630 [Aureliella helgolandensis]